MYTDVMGLPHELASYSKLFFTIVVKVTHVRLESLTMNSHCTTCVIWDSIESTENRKC